MNKKRTFIAVLAGLAATACLAGCSGGGGGGGSITTIKIKQHAGTGTKETPKWVEQCADRFMEANKNTSFGDGKKGVKITFKDEKLSQSTYDTLGSDGFNIIIDETRFDAYRYKNNMMDISSVVDKYKDKIDPLVLTRCKADQSSEVYYGLPFFEYFPGISYDIDLFTDSNYYFADSSVSSPITYAFSLNNDLVGSFVRTKDDMKSVGPDGVRNTSDDGLPSSLDEFIILCDRIKDEGNQPVILCSSGTQYSWYLVHGLWASLAGADIMNAAYCNYLPGGTPAKVVTGFGDEDLFYSGSGIKEPITEDVLLTDDNGYLVYETVERYYALAIFEILFKNGRDTKTTWLDTADAKEAKDAQDLFIKGMADAQKGTYSYGMLFDASYWYHEDRSTIDRWVKDNGRERNLAHMPLPTQISGSVTEGNGKKNTLIDTGSTFIFVNKNTEKEADKKAACLAFLEFLYSDEELNSFSSVTGLTVPKDYGYDTSNLEPFYKQLGIFRKEANVIPYASTSNRFIKNIAAFNLGYGSNLCNVNGNQEGFLKNLQTGMNSRTIFEGTKLDKTKWDGMQK